MPILIDGYNLLFEGGLAPARVEVGALQRARYALLSLLAEALSPAAAAQTTIIFDAAHPPPNRPRQFLYRGITVLFADDGKDADTVIEELIQRHPTPRKLRVISSDHRVQRAARRRGATPLDSGPWYDELRMAQRHAADTRPHDAGARTAAGEHTESLDYWLAYFGLSDEDAPPGEDKPSLGKQIDKQSSRPVYNPFPEGYGEDLLDGGAGK